MDLQNYSVVTNYKLPVTNKEGFINKKLLIGHWSLVIGH